MRHHYENADTEFPAEAYTVAGWGKGIAFEVLGWETEPDEDTDWSGYEVRTGNLVVQMIGDDRHFVEEPESLTALSDDAFCRDCGQVGCHHNVYA